MDIIMHEIRRMMLLPLIFASVSSAVCCPHLFVLAQEGADRPNNENAISYQLCLYQPNISETTWHKTEVSASDAKEKVL